MLGALLVPMCLPDEQNGCGQRDAETGVQPQMARIDMIKTNGFVQKWLDRLASRHQEGQAQQANIPPPPFFLRLFGRSANVDSLPDSAPSTTLACSPVRSSITPVSTHSPRPGSEPPRAGAGTPPPLPALPRGGPRPLDLPRPRPSAALTLLLLLLLGWAVATGVLSARAERPPSLSRLLRDERRSACAALFRCSSVSNRLRRCWCSSTLPSRRGRARAGCGSGSGRGSGSGSGGSLELADDITAPQPHP